MELTERLRELYFRKYDDQMGGLDEDEEKEFKLLNKQILQNQANSEMYEWAIKEFGIGLSEAVDNYKHFKGYIDDSSKEYVRLIKLEERLKERIEAKKNHQKIYHPKEEPEIFTLSDIISSELGELQNIYEGKE